MKDASCFHRPSGLKVAFNNTQCRSTGDSYINSNLANVCDVIALIFVESLEVLIFQQVGEIFSKDYTF
jgi:hypothetical protein